jgi:hypothetical protein
MPPIIDLHAQQGPGPLAFASGPSLANILSNPYPGNNSDYDINSVMQLGPQALQAALQAAQSNYLQREHERAAQQEAIAKQQMAQQEMSHKEWAKQGDWQTMLSHYANQAEIANARQSSDLYRTLLGVTGRQDVSDARSQSGMDRAKMIQDMINARQQTGIDAQAQRQQAGLDARQWKAPSAQDMIMGAGQMQGAATKMVTDKRLAKNLTPDQAQTAYMILHNSLQHNIPMTSEQAILEAVNGPRAQAPGQAPAPGTAQQGPGQAGSPGQAQQPMIPNIMDSIAQRTRPATQDALQILGISSPKKNTGPPPIPGRGPMGDPDLEGMSRGPRVPPGTPTSFADLFDPNMMPSPAGKPWLNATTPSQAGKSPKVLLGLWKGPDAQPDTIRDWADFVDTYLRSNPNYTTPTRQLPEQNINRSPRVLLGLWPGTLDEKGNPY